MMPRWLPVVLLFLSAGVSPVTEARAQSPELKGTYRDWNLFTYKDKSGRICYIASEPQKMQGDYSKRGPAAVLVAKFPIKPPNVQVSVQAGYPYKKNSTVTMKIDKKSYSLFTDGENAFARTAQEDKRIIEAMKKGRRMTVRGTSRKGTYSLDTYSLLGFTRAYRAMLDACKR